MANNKQKKKEIVDETTALIKDSGAVAFVKFSRIKVVDTTEMRKEMKKQGVTFRVMKKTLLSRALKGAGVEGDIPELEGEIGISYGKDQLAPAREVYAFVKKFKDQLAIVGGVFDGKIKDKVAMNEIATIPPREVLIGQFVNLINSPIQGLVIGLKAIADKKS
jgi:large subunit ribosomal protein L10